MKYYAKALADKNHRIFLVSTSNKISEQKFKEIAENIFLLSKENNVKGLFGTLHFFRSLHAYTKQKGGNSSFLFYPTQVIPIHIWGLLYLKFYRKYSLYYELNEVRKYVSSYEDPLSLKKLIYSIKKIIYKSAFTILEPTLAFYDGLVCISTAIEEYGRKYNHNTIRVPILTDPEIKFELSDRIYSTPGKFNIGFSGSIIPSKENLDGFTSVLSKVNETGYQICFNLCGTISQRDYEEFIDNHKYTYQINYYGNLNELN